MKDLVKAVPLLHQLAEQDDHDVGFGGGHGPRGRTCINTGGKEVKNEEARKERKEKKNTRKSEKEEGDTHDSGNRDEHDCRNERWRRETSGKGSSAEKVPSRRRKTSAGRHARPRPPQDENVIN